MGNRITELKVKYVSLVKSPANMRSFLIAKSEDSQNVMAKSCTFLEKNLEQRKVTGIVYEPNVKDAHGDFMRAEDIEKSAHDYLKEFSMVDKNHDYEDRNYLNVVESWVAKEDTKIGKKLVKQGTWLMTIEVNDDNTWQEVKKGSFNGFSLAGTCRMVDEALKTKNKGDDVMNQDLEAIKKELETTREALKKANEDLIEKEALIKKSADEKEQARLEKEKAEQKEKNEALAKQFEKLEKMFETVQKNTAMAGAGDVKVNKSVEQIEKEEKAHIEYIAKGISIANNDNLLPEKWQTDIMHNLEQYSTILTEAKQYNCNSAGSVTQFIRDTSITADQLSESQAGTEQDLTWKEVVFDVKRIQACIPVTDDLLQSTPLNVRSEITSALGEGLAYTINAKFIDGVTSGTNSIEGFKTNTDVATAVASSDKVTFDELKDLMGSVASQHMLKGTFYVNQKTWLEIATMKNTNGLPVYQPSNREGDVDLLIGRPVKHLPELDNSDVAVLYANMPSFYGFCMQTGVSSETDRDPATVTTKYYGRKWVGGKVLLANSGAYLTTPATAGVKATVAPKEKATAGVKATVAPKEKATEE